MAGRSVPAFGRRLPTAARLFLAPLGPLTPPKRTGQGKGASDTSPVGRRGTPLLWPPPRRAVSRDGASPPEWRPRPDVTALLLDLSDLGDPCVARLASSTAASTSAPAFVCVVDDAFERSFPGRGEGERPTEPPSGLPPSCVVISCRPAELPGNSWDGLDRRRGSRGTRTRCTRTCCTRGNPRRARRTRLSRRSHRGRSTSVIAGVLRVARPGVFAARAPPLGSGVAVRVHIAVGVRVGGRRSRRHRDPAHRYGQCCCRHQTDNRFSHLFPLSTCLSLAFERRWFRPRYTIWTSRPLPPFGVADDLFQSRSRRAGDVLASARSLHARHGIRVSGTSDQVTEHPQERKEKN